MLNSAELKEDIILRVQEAARLILENPEATVRSIAKQLGVSKSTVHKDLSDRLPAIDPQRFEEVKDILEVHWNTKHIKGGEATKRLYNR